MLGIHFRCMQTEGQHFFFSKYIVQLSEEHSGMVKTDPDKESCRGLVLKGK